MMLHLNLVQIIIFKYSFKRYKIMISKLIYFLLFDFYIIKFSRHQVLAIMESQSQNSENQQQLQIDIIPLQDKYQKVLTLNHQVRAQIQDLTKKAIKKSLLNSHLDSRNQARPYPMKVMRQNIQFHNFMTKKKNQSRRKQAFQIMREMLEQKGYNNVSTLSQKQPRSVLVVRFVNKVQNQSNVMEIEDDLCKQREKIVIKQGVAWVGLICAIEAVYENQMYRLQKIIDLCTDSTNKNALNQNLSLHHPPNAYRVLMVKGPFWKTNGKDNVGVQLIVNQVQSLRYKQNVRIDLLIVMGPILSQKNQNIQNCTLDCTFEDSFEDIIQTLKKNLKKVLPDIQIIVIPSSDDIISNYPIPQPPFDISSLNVYVKFASNPCTVRLQNQCKINLINYDIISYFDQFKCGKAIKQPLIQNIQTYLKQPFFITNTLDDSPFDQTNLNALFNRGQFGNIIVISSQRHPVFAHKVKGNKIFINIGSLGIDYHAQEKHFMTLMSIFQGQGEICQRVKVQSIIM